MHQAPAHTCMLPCMLSGELPYKFAVLTSSCMRAKCANSQTHLTRKPWMPWLVLPMMVCANTTHHCACTALFVIQYLWLSVVGLWMSKLLVRGCQVAVVCISTALLPADTSDSTREGLASDSDTFSMWRD